MNPLAEVTFEDADKNLFQVDDPRLRADALKHSVLPRLHLLLNHCISLIRQVYGIEVFDDSIVSCSPGFREKRQRELKLLYRWAFVGLGGSRTKNKWHGLQRPNGKPVQIVPFRFGFGLEEEGLGLSLTPWAGRLTDDSSRKLLQFHIDFESSIHRLCYFSGLRPTVNYDDGLDPLASISEHYQAMLQKHLFTPHFYPQVPMPYPVISDTVERIAEQYVVFFPIYDAYIQISKDAPSRFRELLQKANQWLRSLSQEPDATDRPAAGITSEHIEARQAAEQRVKVMPALRWQVFQRDNWTCLSCGRGSNDAVILHVDHIVPRSRGGQDALANYQTLCHLCNIGKSNRDDTDLRTLAAISNDFEAQPVSASSTT